MAKHFLTRENIDYHIHALSELTADTPRQFGTMTAHEMLRHLRYSKEMSMGEVQVQDESTPIVRALMRKFIFEWVTTWPGGKVKAAPSMDFPTSEYDFDEERQKLIDTMHRFLEVLEKSPDKKTMNPMLGATTIRYWSRIHGLHMNHHFRQFGIK
jgi:Protein of unknown function (DUF1569)